jgi:hypothetical protein
MRVSKSSIPNFPFPTIFNCGLGVTLGDDGINLGSRLRSSLGDDLGVTIGSRLRGSLGDDLGFTLDNGGFVLGGRIRGSFGVIVFGGTFGFDGNLFGVWVVLGLLRRTGTLLGLVIALLGGLLGWSLRGSLDGRFVLGKSRGRSLVGCLLGRGTLGRLLGRSRQTWVLRLPCSRQVCQRFWDQ